MKIREAITIKFYIKCMKNIKMVTIIIIVVPLILISFGFKKCKNNSQELVNSVKFDKNTERYTVQFKESGSYEIVNSSNKSLLLIRVGEKEKTATLPRLNDSPLYVQRYGVKEELIDTN